MTESGKILIANNIYKKYDEHIVLDNVSLELHPGSITTIIGPSGSGKSTLLRAVSMIDPPNSGSVEINGKTYVFPNHNNTLKNNSPWPKITLVFQQLFLWPHRVDFGPLVRIIHKLTRLSPKRLPG